MTVDAEGLLSDAFLEGLAHGNQHSVAQLRTVFDSMKNQIVRLEGNNDKLRSRVKILLHNHAELERTVVELKARQSSDLEESKKEIFELQNELEKLRRESITFCKQTEAVKQGLESSIADKNRVLIEMKAENLILKDQLEEQGLQFAQYQSRSEITKDLINEIRDAITSVQTVQASNQSTLQKFSTQVCNAKQEYLDLKTAHEELELVLASKTSIIESYERKIKELEDRKPENSWRSKDMEVTDFVTQSVNDFRQRISEMKARGNKHIEDLHNLASFSSSELLRLSRQAVALDDHPGIDLFQADCRTNTVCLDTGQVNQATFCVHSSEMDKAFANQDSGMNTLPDLSLGNSEFQSEAGSGSRKSVDIAVSTDKENPDDVVLNVSGLFPIVNARI